MISSGNLYVCLVGSLDVVASLNFLYYCVCPLIRQRQQEGGRGSFAGSDIHLWGSQKDGVLISGKTDDVTGKIGEPTLSQSPALPKRAGGVCRAPMYRGKTN